MNHPAVARGLEPLLGLGTKPADGHPGRPDVLAHAFLGEVERDLVTSRPAMTSMSLA